MEYTKKKTNYFYIDESGGISNDSKLFIHGCIRTDSPNTISEALLRLKQDIIDNVYYDKLVSKIKEQGFHATENNMDMRADVYKLIPLLEYRSYFVIINKETEQFKNLVKTTEEHIIFTNSLRKLILDRIVSNKNDKNIFHFENIQISKKPLSSILKEIFESIDKSFDCEFKIVGKEEENMGVIDYLNFLLYSLLSVPIPSPRMTMNFDLVSPKIGVIVIQNNDVHLNRKKKSKHRIKLENLLREFGGLSE